MSVAAPVSDLVVRGMRWWDIEQAHVVETRSFPQTPWSQETFWSELAGVPSSRHYVVAESAGQVVGYAGLMVVGREADIQTLAVAAAPGSPSRWKHRATRRSISMPVAVSQRSPADRTTTAPAPTP